jgi:hypothetical protein
MEYITLPAGFQLEPTTSKNNNGMARRDTY